MNRSHIKAWWLVVGLLFVGAMFRIHHLGAQDLWGDEAWTWYLTTQEDFWHTLAGDVHPPVYFGALYVWSQFTGQSELALRYLSVLFGMIGVATMYPLAREVLRWRPASTTEMRLTFPLIAVFLLAIADMEVHVAQEARTYSLQIMLAMVSTLSYLRWARTGQRQWAMMWMIANVGIVHTHYLGVWTPVAHGLHLLFFVRGKRRLEGMSWLVASGLFFMPWLLSVVLGQQLGTFSSNLPTDASTWETLWGYRVSFFTQQWALMIALALLGMVVWRSDGGRKTPRIFGSGMLLFFWATVPVVSTYIANHFLPLLFDYRISQIVPPITLLIALGLIHLRGRERLFLLVVIGVYGFLATDVYRPKPDWSGYADLVARYVQPDDAVLSDFSGGDYTVTYYLGYELDANIPVRSMWQWRYWEPETYEAGIFHYLESYDTLWVPRWNTADTEVFDRMALVGHQQTDRRTFDLYGSTLEILRYDRLSQDEPLAKFDNGMHLIRASINQEGGVALLWRVDNALRVDYTIAVYLLDEQGQVIAQQDAMPYVPTSQWQPDDLRFDGKRIPLDGVTNGDYRLGIAVYEWSPEGITNALTEGETVWLGDIFSVGLAQP